MRGLRTQYFVVVVVVMVLKWNFCRHILFRSVLKSLVLNSLAYKSPAYKSLAYKSLAYKSLAFKSLIQGHVGHVGRVGKIFLKSINLQYNTLGRWVAGSMGQKTWRPSV